MQRTSKFANRLITINLVLQIINVYTEIFLCNLRLLNQKQSFHYAREFSSIQNKVILVHTAYKCYFLVKSEVGSTHSKFFNWKNIYSNWLYITRLVTQCSIVEKRRIYNITLVSAVYYPVEKLKKPFILNFNKKIKKTLNKLYLFTHPSLIKVSKETFKTIYSPQIFKYLCFDCKQDYISENKIWEDLILDEIFPGFVPS